MGGRYSIKELERRIDPHDGEAYIWEEYCEYYTKQCGWFVFQALEAWHELELARPHLLVGPLSSEGSAGRTGSVPGGRGHPGPKPTVAGPAWMTTI